MQVEVDVQLHPDLYTEGMAQTTSGGPSVVCGGAALPAQDWQRWFTQWFESLQPDLSPIQSYALSLTLTTDPDIHQLNATYRGCDVPTDVLAFATRDTLGLPETIWQIAPMELGDIVISVDTALRQAAEHHHTPHQELVWLASHGCLHLLGWDHPDSNALQKMLAQQDRLLQVIGLT